MEEDKTSSFQLSTFNFQCVAVEALGGVDEVPEGGGDHVEAGVGGEEGVPAELVEDPGAHGGLGEVAEVADGVDEARGDAGVAAADVYDGGPVGALAEVGGDGGDAEEEGRLLG